MKVEILKEALSGIIELLLADHQQRDNVPLHEFKEIANCIKKVQTALKVKSVPKALKKKS